MTIEEAIKHCEKVIEDNENTLAVTEPSFDTVDMLVDCKKCAAEHRQLAEWLRELQGYRSRVQYEREDILHKVRTLIIDEQTCTAVNLIDDYFGEV